ncbi:hypothetical protein [Estrella lausannensis]|uniref:Uncharacterized protein n=1 Tax=Estrella lausannensis TaxID=483423 RepID=A0A0H5DSN5_9BACT|nr:hypothetical protein [Estrella lausannensis]CRX38804.1 hypothetical protein ELAC_1468 [Estrella lausannensis]
MATINASSNGILSWSWCAFTPTSPQQRKPNGLFEKRTLTDCQRFTPHVTSAVEPGSMAGRALWVSAIPEMELEICSHFTVRFLLRMRAVSKHFLQLSNQSLVRQLNSGGIALKDIGIISIEGLVNFFGKEGGLLTKLDLRRERGNVTGSPVTDNDLLQISRHFRQVKHLYFKESSQTSASESYYAAMPHLETLVADSFSNICNLNFLKSSAKLKVLRVERSVANILDITSLARCSELEVFYARGGSSITDITCFGQCRRLKKIVLSGWSHLADVSALENCEKLETVDLFMCIGIENIVFFKKMPALKKICLQGCISLPLDQQQYFRSVGLLFYLNEKRF